MNECEGHPMDELLQHKNTILRLIDEQGPTAHGQVLFHLRAIKKLYGKAEVEKTIAQFELDDLWDKKISKEVL